jgi:predicted nucleic acid-binding protein
MPSTNPHHLYWDSCVFLSIFNAEPTRHPTLRRILDEVRASRGALKICTSTLTLVEVAFVIQEKTQRQLEDRTLAVIDGLLDDRTTIQLIEANRFIMTLARSYVREAMVNQHPFKPPDAIHLATAVYAQLGTFHTYNLKDFQPMAHILSLQMRVTLPMPLSQGPLFDPPTT